MFADTTRADLARVAISLLLCKTDVLFERSYVQFHSTIKGVDICIGYHSTFLTPRISSGVFNLFHHFVLATDGAVVQSIGLRKKP